MVSKLTLPAKENAIQEKINELVDDKQDTLVSGTNIKTVNGNSLLGSGDISITQAVAWGNITGTLSDQTDLNNALSTKYDASNPDGFITGITSGDVTTALGYTPVNPSNLATVATSGSYNDLSNKPIVDQTYDGTSTNAQSGVAVASAISGKADTGLSNLTSQGQNIANWSSNVTNCITEIPQDIKLELNNAKLTLKAGSKVYVPNGAGVFDVVTINTDITTQGSDDNTQYIMFYYPQGGYIGKTAKSNVVSGPDGSSVGNYGFWYDTTNNIIKRKLGGVFDAGGYSLPFGLSTATSSGIQSIDQVFNGFGYIGSTVFALPGVKGLIPNGRNADGSLKSIEFTISNVLTIAQPVSGWNGRWSLYFNALSITFHPTELEYISDTKPTGVYTPTAFWYSPLDNKLYFTQDTGATWTQIDVLHCVDFTENNTKITSLTSKIPFHALDYNDSSTISSWAMPSGKYINLTLGASGSQYAAPANGVFIFSKRGTAAGQWITAGCDAQRQCYTSSANGAEATIYMFVKKGDVLTLTYSLAGVNIFSRFIYAEGEN